MTLLLKQILKEKGITIAEFERMVGVKRHGLVDGERRMPSMNMLERYAELLNVPVWSLIYDCGVPAVPTSIENANAINKCPHCGNELEIELTIKPKEK